MSNLRIESPSFAAGQAIPLRHTCEGEDASPELNWSGAPEGTVSFALIVDDPDAPDPAAPKMTYVHWVLYDIPAEVTSLAEGTSPPTGSRDGLNDWKQAGYGGPCPPIGTHRYFFKLYALDRALGDLKRPTKDTLLKAMEGHVLAQAELMGTYIKAEA